MCSGQLSCFLRDLPSVEWQRTGLFCLRAGWPLWTLSLTWRVGVCSGNQFVPLGGKEESHDLSCCLLIVVADTVLILKDEFLVASRHRSGQLLFAGKSREFRGSV